MVAVPPDTPLTTPVVEPIEATPEPLLLHVPPPVISLNVVVLPVHTDVVPEIPLGAAFTVTVVVAEQPVDDIV